MSTLISQQSLPVLSKDAVDHICPQTEADENSVDTEKYEQLKRKKNKLEEQLNKKLRQLEALCLEEAEIIGEWPSDVPISDQNNASVPSSIKIGAEFNLNTRLLSKSSTDVREAIDLKLEIELQRKIVKANFKLSNQVNLTKSLRKKRLQSYHDAIIKLKELEKKLNDVQKKDGKFDKSDISNIVECKSSPTVDTVDSGRRTVIGITGDERSVKKASNTLSVRQDEHILSTSAPSTPVRMRRRPPLLPPLSPVLRSVPPVWQAGPQVRPRSTHLPSTVSENESIQRLLTNQLGINSFRDGDTCSLASSGSCESSVFKISNEGKRRNILSLLQNSYDRLSDRCCNSPLDLAVSQKKWSVINNKRSSSTSENISIDRRAQLELLQNELAASGGSDLTWMKSLERVKAISTSTDLQSITINRNDSVDSLRRKSYVTAINATANSRPSSRQETVVMKPTGKSYRPLPRTPVSISPSLQAMSQVTGLFESDPFPITDKNVYQTFPSTSTMNTALDDHHDYLNIDDEKMSMPAIRAVRSSIIRTPITINMSTVSCNDTSTLSQYQLKNQGSLATSANSTLSHHQQDINLKTKETTENSRPSSVLSDMSIKLIKSLPEIDRYENAKSWVESTQIHAVPSMVDGSTCSGLVEHPPPVRNLDTTSEPISNRVSTLEFVISTGSTIGETDLTSAARVESSIGRPMSIPLSPTVKSAGNCEVVSVGHFQPYWEETKPYEMADFFKYSTKHRNRVTQQKPATESSNSSKQISQKSIPPSSPNDGKTRPTLV